MAKLIPPYIDKYCKSSAERLLFDIFKNNNFAQKWVVLHSLNLSQHTTRLYGEIDFLLLIPEGGIFVVEVKGGDVKCTDGVWHYRDKFGNDHTSSIGPFNQARDAMFSLRSAIEREFGRGHRLTRILTGFLCSFPHVSFDKHSVEYEQWQVMDKDVIDRGLDAFFKNLITQYTNKFRNQKWFTESESLPSAEDIEALCNFLRGDFERVRTIKERLHEFNNQVNSYTDEQYRVLDHIQFNDRNLIQGSAGTGKTMIAMESAVRAAQDGKSVFLTCYNRLIGEWMQKQLEDYKEKVKVSSLHNFLFESSQGFDYDKSQSDGQDFYSKYLPQLLTEMFKKGINKKFDKIIIDEGQDLIREEYLALFDAMLLKGLDKGNWEIYGDFERQAIFAQLSKEDMLSLICRYSVPSKFLLKVNCRNTKQIGEETSLISGFEKPPFLLEYLEGIPVEYAFYNDCNHQANLVSEKLSELSSNGLPFNELTIISPKKKDNSCVSPLMGNSIIELKHWSEFKISQTYFLYSTIQSYKGMECNYIMITDIEDLKSEFSKSIMYVGMSRARYGLIMLISENIKDQYKEILLKKIC